MHMPAQNLVLLAAFFLTNLTGASAAQSNPLCPPPGMFNEIAIAQKDPGSSADTSEQESIEARQEAVRLLRGRMLELSRSAEQYELQSVADNHRQRLATPPEAAAKPECGDENGWWSVRNAMTISSVVLGFGLLVVIAAGWMIGKGQPAQDVLRMLGTVLIIVSAVFLVVAGYSDTQIAPVMGLLGTIVGYLLGKDSGQQVRKKKKQVPPRPADPPAPEQKTGEAPPPAAGQAS